MTIHAALNHRTSYRYDRAISLGPQIVRLRPAPHSRTKIISYGLKIGPEQHWINWQQDPFSNWQARLVFQEPTRFLDIEVDLVAEMAVLNPFDFFISPDAEIFPFAYDQALGQDLAPFLAADPAGPRLKSWLGTIDRRPIKTIDFLVALNQRLSNEISYLIRMEPGVQTPEETLERGSGSCRDTGWLLVQVLRHLGMAARFTSGYLIQLKPDQKSLDGPSGAEKDFCDLHAWCEVYLPGAGWIGLDPTSGLLAGEGHIPIAATPSPQSAAPISGALEKAGVEFDYAMSVTRVHQTPRVTLPYDTNQWSAILAAGDAIDVRLKEGDVRLTTGGEPTFVSIDDRDGAEWNTEAVGPTKPALADQLIRRLQDRFAPGGLLQHGQGKWYPGEPLPRWAFALYWRDDDEPLWQNSGLIAAEDGDADATIDDAKRVAEELCAELELDPNAIHPAFEDAAHYQRLHDRLPTNLDAENNKLEQPEDSARLARVFRHGLDQPASFVLPLQVWQAKAAGNDRGRRFRWKSEHWVTRDGRLVLLPGDSPAGFRLPLGSLPDLDDGDRPEIIIQDPFAARGRLPVRAPVMQANLADGMADIAPGAGFEAGVPVRTALTIEPRDGRVCIFLPPVASADEFVDLAGAVAEVASRLEQPVRLEGYPPPDDPRLKNIKVTPDPGVIEVNIQPAASWRDQVAITEAVYDEARQCRLDTAKFMIDGRAAGTGGGNHVVVGGPSAADSPFLRRPDLLASLIRYWQNHPALSYLFSGMFIGPTSQAPRIDEARSDQLYELEIALRQIPNPASSTGGDCPPWLVDRIFRNLLVDLAGNTHRAEICIDKLYSPDGPTGRLGLVEFRAFEMPPHAAMSLTQQLLLRGLIAWFWQRPYHGRLQRFGTHLHDRFMLPRYLEQDLDQVLADLSDAGMPFDRGWFKPHLEFRFPHYGSFAFGDARIEIRAALEPWHVLGEESAAGGTARYVDSSLERLEVRLCGKLCDRYVLTCNGYRVPLRDTGDGTAVAGIRFRAWQPPSGLHPTIGVHSPLAFDIVDTGADHAVIGAAYHVMHPAGRGYEIMPVNEFEAQGRMLSRFETGRHTTGRIQVREPDLHDDFPCTLDLRRQ